jgi:cytochrome c-type biogenesis protein CcmH/NrfG
MLSDPVFIFIALLACLGLLFCVSILINSKGSKLWKNSAYGIAFIMISSFVYLNYEMASNLKESQEASNDQIMDSVVKLEEFLISNPNDLSVLKALGSHYIQIGRFELAYEKFLKAYQFQGEQNDFDINLGLIESTLMVRPNDFPYDIDQLIEETLIMNPENTQILWLSGLIAMGRGDVQLTIERWSGLVDNPEVSLEIQNSISTQLDQLKRMEEGVAILNDQ